MSEGVPREVHHGTQGGHTQGGPSRHARHGHPAMPSRSSRHARHGLLLAGLIVRHGLLLAGLTVLTLGSWALDLDLESTRLLGPEP